MNKEINNFSDNLDEYNVSVKKLLTIMNQSSSLWNDRKYEEFSAEIIKMINYINSFIIKSDDLKIMFLNYQEYSEQDF